MLKRLDALKTMVHAVTELQNSGYSRVDAYAKSNADYVLKDSNFEEVLKFKNFLDARIDTPLGSPIIVEIDGFGGDVFAAEQVVNIIADYAEYVRTEHGDPIRLKVGSHGLISAGHILWYNPRLSSLWTTRVALVCLHQVSTLCKADLPFVSENVRALCAHHTIDNGGYDNVLSLRCNELHNGVDRLMNYDCSRDPLFEEATDALLQLADANRIPTPIDYVEMFRFVRNINDAEFGIESDVAPVRQQTNLHGKVEEEMFEMHFESKGINAITERLDFINGLMLSWITGHKGTFTYERFIMAVMASKRIYAVINDMTAAVKRDENCEYELFNRIAAPSIKWLTKHYLTGAYEYWFSHQLKRGRVQAVSTLAEFIEWLQSCQGTLREYRRFVEFN